jgi:hypothetical protein
MYQKYFHYRFKPAATWDFSKTSDSEGTAYAIFLTTYSFPFNSTHFC